jgi:F420-dependent oxidoreductase-like protein
VVHTHFATALKRVAAAAEDAGFARLSVADHLWQIEANGAPEDPMLEAYTTLGFLAACTSRVELLTWVTAATYREPAMLAKCVTTLDVLSGGRAWLGIGAGWYEEEARGLGLCFPPLAERFERLDEVVKVCRLMFDHGTSNRGVAFDGKHFQLARILNSPPPLHRVPVMIGGGGEKKTLRLVAMYADACNLFATPDLERKLDVLREHCESVGRDYDDLEKTVVMPMDPGPEAENVETILDELQWLAKLGIAHVHSKVSQAVDIAPLELVGERIIPEAARF